MSFIFYLSPFIILFFIVFVAKKVNIITMNRKHLDILIYWIFVFFMYFLFLVNFDCILFVPALLLFSWFYGTFLTVIFLIYTLFIKISVKEKIIYILISIGLNYIIFPFSLIWIGS